MARYYRKRRFYRKKNKWSIEQRPGFIQGNGWVTAQDQYLNRQALIPIVQSTQQEGVRKAKNLSISVATPSPNNQANVNYTFYWALIYLPEGQTPGELASTGQLYTPSQFVISSGIVTSEQGKMRITSRLARNLNQGDSIYLLIGTNSTFLQNSTDASYRFNYLVRYAICYN